MLTTGDATLCGWRVQSDVAMPELARWSYGKHAPKIQIVLRNTQDSHVLRGARQLSLLTYSGANGGWILSIPGIGTFMVRDGNHITATRDASGTEEDLRSFVLGPVLGALCRQRRLLTVRATTMAYENGAVAICGEAGIGKSATGYVLSRSGFRLISDGVTVVNISPKNALPYVLATHRVFHLWRSAIDTLSIPHDSVVQSRASLAKFAWKVEPEAFDAMSIVPLRHIIILSQRARVKSRAALEDGHALEHRFVKHLYIDNSYEEGLTSEEIVGLCRQICATVQFHDLPMCGGTSAAKEIIERVIR